MEKEKFVLKFGMRRLIMTLICCAPLHSAPAQLRPPVIEPTEIEAVYTLEFTDNFGDAAPRAVTPLGAKAQRVSSDGGVITLNFDNAVPDSVRISAEVAANIWAARLLHENDTVAIKIEYGVFDWNDDIKTEVFYNKSKDDKNLFYPWSYYFNRIEPMKTEYNAAIIYINSKKEWECDFSENKRLNVRNLPSGLLRAIGNVFGFGASLTEKKRRGETFVAFANSPGYSLFDELIFNSEWKWLSEIPNLGTVKNDELTTFVTPAEGVSIYASKPEDAYKLYAPPAYELWRSLCYLDNPRSLMHHDLNEGDKFLAIDQVTLGLLEDIGWEAKAERPVKIICEDIGPDGIGDANYPHNFSLETNGAISNGKWSFRLNGSNGGMVPVNGSSQTMGSPSRR